MPGIKMRATHRKGAERVRAVNTKRSIAACDAAMKRPMVSVKVKSNPFQPRRPLYTKLPAMDDALRTMLGSYMKAMKDNPSKLAPHSIAVHEDHCAFGVILWPRASDGADLEDMQDAVAERDGACGCTPLVMYPGALA